MKKPPKHLWVLMDKDETVHYICVSHKQSTMQSELEYRKENYPKFKTVLHKYTLAGEKK